MTAWYSRARSSLRWAINSSRVIWGAWPSPAAARSAVALPPLVRCSAMMPAAGGKGKSERAGSALLGRHLRALLARLGPADGAGLLGVGGALLRLAALEFPFP